MKVFTTSDNPDINYLAQIVELKHVEKHPNADKLQIATVAGTQVVTGLQAKPGDLYIYFPVECVIDSKYLCWSNNYSESERNKDITKKGFFSRQNRVKMVKLRGCYSNGYIVPVSDIEQYIQEFYGQTITISQKDVDTSFDSILGDRFVKKYVRNVVVQGAPRQKTKGNIKKFESRLVPNQFKFHEDTINLRKDIAKINHEDYITIQNKINGASWIVGKVLTLRKLSVLEKIAKWLGANIKTTEYGEVYASRTVIKSDKEYNQSAGYYDNDIWKIVANRVYPMLDDGVTLYGEVFGFTPTGKYIQPGYDYGCPSNQLDFIVYKGAITLPDGRVYVMNYPQLAAYCEEKGFKMPETYYYGKAKDLFPDLDTHNHWHDGFLKKLEETYLEKYCDICKNKVPAEGICISKQVPFRWDCLKLKSFKFLEKESAVLDSEELSVEEQVSEE